MTESPATPASPSDATAPPAAPPLRPVARILSNRYVYLGLIVGMMLWLYLAGGGRTQTEGGFQRRVNVRLQVIEHGIGYTNWHRGIVVAEGKGVFEILDLADEWADYQAGKIEIDEAAARVAVQVTKARERFASLPGYDEVAPRIVALPLPKRIIHPALSDSQAASKFVIRRNAKGLPLWAVILGEEPGDSAYPVLRDYLTAWGSDVTHERVVDEFLARIDNPAFTLRHDDEEPGIWWVESPTAELPAMAWIAHPSFAEVAVEQIQASGHWDDTDGPVEVIEVIVEGLDRIALRAVQGSDQDWFLRYGNIGREDFWIGVNVDAVPADILRAGRQITR